MMRSFRAIGRASEVQRGLVAYACGLVLFVSTLEVWCQEGSVCGGVLQRATGISPGKVRGAFMRSTWHVLMKRAGPEIIEEAEASRWPECVVYRVAVTTYRRTGRGWWALTTAVRRRYLRVGWVFSNRVPTEEQAAGDFAMIVRLLRRVHPDEFAWAPAEIPAGVEVFVEESIRWPGAVQNVATLLSAPGLLWAIPRRRSGSA